MLVAKNTFATTATALLAPLMSHLTVKLCERKPSLTKMIIG
jgi:hypothetical protein